MLPTPLEHSYTLDGERYTLREAVMFEGQSRIQQYYALALALMPGALHPETGLPIATQEPLWSAAATAYSRALENISGATCYAKAVTQECLVEAPDLWWVPQPVTPGMNGTVRRVVTFKNVTAALWTQHFREVNTFLEAIFRGQAETSAPVAPGGAAEPDAVAPAQALTPVLRGRAE
jgi:hypothetical protein